MSTKDTFTSVSATGSAETCFNSVSYNLTIIGRGKDNASARGQVDTIYAQVKQAIAELNQVGAGIDVSPTGMKCGYNCQPWVEYDRSTNEQKQKGYQVTGTVSCSSEEVDAATLVMDVLTKIEGATVQNPSFTTDDAAQYRKAAFTAAYNRAMEDFRLQCVVLGENPDHFKVASFTTSAPMRHHHGGEESVRAMASMAPSAPPMEITAGMAEITATVSLTFVRKPKTKKPPARADASSGAPAKSGNGSTAARATNVG